MDSNQSQWSKKRQNSKRTRWIIIVIAILVLAGVVGGVAYFLLNKSNSNNSNAGSSGQNSNGGGGGGPLSGSGTGTGSGSGSSNNGGKTGGGGTTAGNSSTNAPPNSNAKYYTNDGKLVDLKITPNPALKKSFYGINYGPILALYPWCTNTLGDVIEDIKVLSQLTNRLRLYGMDCGMANQTLHAIKILGLKMTVVPTIWVDNNATTYQRQYDDLFAVLKEHGFDYIEGISVGNEVIFRKEIPKQDLFNRIADVRTKVRAMPGAPANMPVFTSDLGSNVDSAFVAASDIIFANVHPYFAGTKVDDAAVWTFQFFEDEDITPAKQGGKQAVMSEVGWPTKGDSQQGAVASIPNLQTFLNTFLCQSNQKGYRYYFFESFDTPWKVTMFTLLEGSWGLFNADRTLKQGIVFPDCAPTAPNLRT